MTPMKPDWTTAPEWAKWLAREWDGTWCWYEKKPWASGVLWVSPGRSKRAGFSWRDSLEQRPEA